MPYNIQKAKRHLDIAKAHLWITESEHESTLERLTGECHHDALVHRVIPFDGTPYGYHQIRKIDPDGSSHVIAMIHSSIAEAELLAIARILATPAPIEIEREISRPPNV